MRQLQLLLLAISWLPSVGQQQAFDLYQKYDSLFTKECLNIFEEPRLLVLYDSLLITDQNARLAALDTIKGMSDEVKKSYKVSINAEAGGRYLQLVALANSNGLSIPEQRMISAQEKCISQFEPKTTSYNFSYDPNEEVSLQEVYGDLANATQQYIAPFEPFWVDLTFGTNQQQSLQFKAEWNEENTDIVTLNVPEGCQICDFSFSQKGSRGNYRIEEGKSFLFEDPENQGRVIKLVLDISSTGSFEFYDRWSSSAKLSKVKLKIMPYYFDEAQRLKYDCYQPKHKRQIKGTEKYHNEQLAYDPKNADADNITLKE